MRLFEIHHANHQAAAAGTVDPIHIIEFTTGLYIAYVEGVGALELPQLFLLEFVKKESLTVRAAVHLDAAERQLHHRGNALWTVHRWNVISGEFNDGNIPRAPQ
jgi:hypothetical protein